MKKKESNSLGLKNKPEPKRAPVYFTYYNYLLFFRILLKFQNSSLTLGLGKLNFLPFFRVFQVKPQGAGVKY